MFQQQTAAPALPTASTTVAGIQDNAVQSEMEASTGGHTVTPDVLKFHPSAAKGWANVGVVADINASYNVSGVTDEGTGQLTVTWDVDFSSANYAPGMEFYTVAFNGCRRVAAIAAGSTRWHITDMAQTLTDPVQWFVWAFGDQ